MMKRRDFITLLGSAAAAWPLAARAQQERIRRIGVLAALTEDDLQMQAQLAGFRQALELLGWSDGRNMRLDYRFARANVDHHKGLAKELVALQPDVILAHLTPVASALKSESQTIPIVFVGVSDPVGSGFVASLARPGGNLTGLLLYEEGITGKWLAMLKEVAPRMTRAAFVASPKTPTYDYFLRAAQEAAASLMIELVLNPVETASEIERAIGSFASLPGGGLLVPPNYTAFLYRDLIVDLAARHHLPAVYPFRAFTSAGGLMSYGTDQVDTFRQAAGYVDRILRGAKPAELPVQAPVKYETIINLKTAKTLGIEIPPTLLARADDVIE